MSKRCLQGENVHPTADGMGRVGMAQLVGVQVDVHSFAPAPLPTNAQWIWCFCRQNAVNRCRQVDLGRKQRFSKSLCRSCFEESGRQDSNLRPSAPKANETVVSDPLQRLRKPSCSNGSGCGGFAS